MKYQRMERGLLSLKVEICSEETSGFCKHTKQSTQNLIVYEKEANPHAAPENVLDLVRKIKRYLIEVGKYDGFAIQYIRLYI
jgi:hypothetical protein